MKVKYFSDTDTVLVEFNDKSIEQTIEVAKYGNLVNITTEHAKENAKLPEFSYQKITNSLKKSA